MDIKEAIAKAADRIDLSEAEAKSVMEIMLSGEATQAQIAAFLTALRMKGETLDELVGLASVLRDKAETIAPEAENYVDLVGTGGDCTYTFNVSTTSAFVVAAAGLPVENTETVLFHPDLAQEMCWRHLVLISRQSRNL